MAQACSPSSPCRHVRLSKVDERFTHGVFAKVEIVLGGIHVGPEFIIRLVAKERTRTP